MSCRSQWADRSCPPWGLGRRPRGHRYIREPAQWRLLRGARVASGDSVLPGCSHGDRPKGLGSPAWRTPRVARDCERGVYSIGRREPARATGVCTDKSSRFASDLGATRGLLGGFARGSPRGSPPSGGGPRGSKRSGLVSSDECEMALRLGAVDRAGVPQGTRQPRASGGAEQSTSASNQRSTPSSRQRNRD